MPDDDDINEGRKAIGAADGKVAPLRKPVPCPECGTPSSRTSFPFCSERCRNVDLNRWLTGAYAIPVVEEDENKEPGEGWEDGSGGRD